MKIKIFIICFFIFILPVKSCFSEIIDYGRWSIPEKIQPEPNYETLVHYLKRYLNDYRKFSKYSVKKSNSPFEFDSALKKENVIIEQLNKTALFSYIFFENDEIIIDEISPDNKFGKLITNETKLFSMSIGKSVVSYILGHAICDGYIESVNEKITDWPLLNNTLYEDAKLIDLINMQAGDQKHVDKKKGLLKTGRWYNNYTLDDMAKKELKNTKKSKPTFNYNGLPPNIVLNYIIFKSGENFQSLINDIFQNKVKIKDEIFFLKHSGYSEMYGPARNSMYATRYDYLRIAKAILDDWKNDTCVGIYLKNIYQNKKSKGLTRRPSGPMSAWRGYAGFFHTDYYQISNRNLIGMDGYGGQMIWIDFDNSRIVSTHSVHNNYNWKKIVAGVIKNGRISQGNWN
tara:strand:+ start:81 stop:1283 length:1203 start_codon:yes stop_codon:yes gene_type:complete